jgi:hypothetical protein
MKQLSCSLNACCTSNSIFFGGEIRESEMGVFDDRHHGMKRVVATAGVILLAGYMLTAPALAHPFAVSGLNAPPAFEQVQYSRAESLAIGRCMRRKYGSRAGRMRSPLRFFMVQACT